MSLCLGAAPRCGSAASWAGLVLDVGPSGFLSGGAEGVAAHNLVLRRALVHHLELRAQVVERAQLRHNLDGAADVLSAINELAANFRKELGEDSLDLDQLAAGETVTAASIEAMKFYTQAQGLARAGQDEEAIEFYARRYVVGSGFDVGNTHQAGRLVQCREHDEFVSV